MFRKQLQGVLKDLKKKMVFVSGPRQVGKTWLAKEMMTHYKRPLYLNYDVKQDQQIIMEQGWFDDVDLLIFDELHKMPQWKHYLKGIYDARPDNMHILVTGSARLDTYRQAGDSLAGRYFIHHLLPLSLVELQNTPFQSDWKRLMTRGGFPEPFLAKNNTGAERWRLQYQDSLIREDILDFENIHNLKAIKLILELIIERVGSPMSYQSIARDVAISPHTVKHYVSILEALYIIFVVTPFSRNIARAILKEPKIYVFDTGLILNNNGAKFENLLAVSLYKHCKGLRDYEAKKIALHYIRTKEGYEVDFCIAVDNKATELIEAKWTDKNVHKPLAKFQEETGLPAKQVVANLTKRQKRGNIELWPVGDYLETLYV